MILEIYGTEPKSEADMREQNVNEHPDEDGKMGHGIGVFSFAVVVVVVSVVAVVFVTAGFVAVVFVAVVVVVFVNWTDRPTDGRTDGQTLLKRCMDASNELSNC